ncbi:hypothetical protein M0812_23848 [Anaeramoeba flamelloides]|uniref:ARMC9 CTLH-like domain-containing protein n=1 Tax=Anaeramoeba flamelloides TaxID=1746091 RepID=A0AAV7YIM0_9EUKA|nr:hypothetical protein M0812_23848 [Anaeramoeba flamelloides]
MDLQTLNFCDEIVEEYLLYRSYSETLRSFEEQKKNHQNRNLSPHMVVKTIFEMISAFSLQGFVDYWEYLNNNFFCFGDSKVRQTSKLLENSLKKMYLVVLFENNQKQKIMEFFQKFSNHLVKNNDWIDWFEFPYLKNPKKDKRFSQYFSKEWKKSFKQSLLVFLQVIFKRVSLPQLLNWKNLQEEKSNLYSKLKNSENEIHKLKNKIEFLQMEIENLKRNVKSRDRSIEIFEKKKRIDDVNPRKTKRKFSTSKESKRRSFSSKGNVTSFSSRTKQEQKAKTSSSSSSSSSEGEENEDYKHLIEQKKQSKSREYQIETHSEYSIPTGSLRKCKVSSTGKRFSVSSTDGSVRVFSLKKPKQKATILNCGSEVRAMVWQGTDDSILVCGNSTSTVKIWDVKKRQNLGDLHIATKPKIIREILYNGNGDQMVIATVENITKKNGSLFALDMNKMKKSNVFKLEPGNVAINSMDFNHNGNLLVTAGSDGMIRLFDNQTEVPIMGWVGHSCEALAIKFSPDETSVISAGSDGKVILWSLSSMGKIIRKYHTEKSKRGLTLRGVEIAFGCENDFLFSNLSPRLSLFNVHNKKRIKTIDFQSSVVSVDWSDQTDFAIMGLMNNKILAKKIFF